MKMHRMAVLAVIGCVPMMAFANRMMMDGDGELDNQSGGAGISGNGQETQNSSDDLSQANSTEDAAVQAETPTQDEQAAALDDEGFDDSDITSEGGDEDEEAGEDEA